MRKALYILTAAIFLFSCKKDKDEPTAQIFPLKDGNQWTYSIKEYEEDGSVSDSYSETRVIKGTKTVNNQTYYVVVNGDDHTDTLGLFRSDEQKVYGFDEDFNKE